MSHQVSSEKMRASNVHIEAVWRMHFTVVFSSALFWRFGYFYDSTILLSNAVDDMKIAGLECRKAVQLSNKVHMSMLEVVPEWPRLNRLSWRPLNLFFFKCCGFNEAWKLELLVFFLCSLVAFDFWQIWKCREFGTRCEHVWNVWNVWTAVRLRGLDERRRSRCPVSQPHNRHSPAHGHSRENLW